MTTRYTSRPLTSVVTQLVSDLTFLMQTEFRLARAEVSEKLSQAASGVMFMGIAAVASLGGLLVLLFGAVRWLEIAGVPNQWGYLIVGGVALIAGALLAIKAVSSLKVSSLKPDRTIEQLRADYSVAKEHVS